MASVLAAFLSRFASRVSFLLDTWACGLTVEAEAECWMGVDTWLGAWCGCRVGVDIWLATEEGVMVAVVGAGALGVSAGAEVTVTWWLCPFSPWLTIKWDTVVIWLAEDAPGHWIINIYFSKNLYSTIINSLTSSELLNDVTSIPFFSLLLYSVSSTVLTVLVELPSTSPRVDRPCVVNLARRKGIRDFVFASIACEEKHQWLVYHTICWDGKFNKRRQLFHQIRRCCERYILKRKCLEA